MAAKPPWLAVHPVTQEDSLGATALRASVAAVKGKLAGTAARGPFDAVMERVAPPTDVTFEADTVGGISGWWAKPARRRKGAAIMHVHGGWFNLGTARAYRNFVGHIASKSRAEADPFFTKSQVAGLVASYLGETDQRNPRASPLYGDSRGLPPIRVHVGDDEVLLDDSRRYVERAVAAGVDAALDVWMGMPHGFVTGIREFAAARQALNAIGAFTAERLLQE